MKISSIINPVAGRGRAAKVWEQIKGPLAKDNDMQYEFTSKPGHATLLAQKAVEERSDALAVVGGDGTVHEAVNGLMGGNTALAVFPAGTGNDFAKTLKLPGSRETTEKFSTFIRKKIDVAKLDEEYFVNIAGVGLDAEVARIVNNASYLKGKLAYLGGIMGALVKFKPLLLEVVVDGIRLREKAMLVAVGNGQYLGGGIRLLPQAGVDDGLLDVCLIKETSVLEALTTLPAVYTGRHILHPKCVFLKGRKISIEVLSGHSTVHAQIDGQVKRKNYLEINVVPQALPVLVPPLE